MKVLFSVHLKYPCKLYINKSKQGTPLFQYDFTLLHIIASRKFNSPQRHRALVGITVRINKHSSRCSSLLMAVNEAQAPSRILKMTSWKRNQVYLTCSSSQASWRRAMRLPLPTPRFGWPRRLDSFPPPATPRETGPHYSKQTNWFLSP